MTLEEIKTISTRGLLEGFGKRDLAAIDEIFSPEMAEGVKKQSALWHSVGPDLEYTVERVVAEGDIACVSWSAVQTHTGVIWGIAPTGKRLEDKGILIFRVADGMIVEISGVWDALGALIQLGAIPTMIAEALKASQA